MNAFGTALILASAGAACFYLGQLKGEERAQKTSSNSALELTCDQLSKQDTSIRGLDGTVYMLKCDANGNPAIPESQERR